jgi:hypothetical protein
MLAGMYLFKLVDNLKTRHAPAGRKAAVPA